MANWKTKLDDLEVGDKIEIDLGDTLVLGRYQGLTRGDAGKWSIQVEMRGNHEFVRTDIIQNIVRK